MEAPSTDTFQPKARSLNLILPLPPRFLSGASGARTNGFPEGGFIGQTICFRDWVDNSTACSKRDPRVSVDEATCTQLSWVFSTAATYVGLMGLYLKPSNGWRENGTVKNAHAHLVAHCGCEKVLEQNGQNTRAPNGTAIFAYRGPHLPRPLANGVGVVDLWDQWSGIPRSSNYMQTFLPVGLLAGFIEGRNSA